MQHRGISYEHKFLVLNPSQTYQSNIIGVNFINKFECLVTHAFSDPRASFKMGELAYSELIPFVVKTKPKLDCSLFNVLEIASDQLQYNEENIRC